MRTYVYGPGIDNILAMTVTTGSMARTYFYITDRLGSVYALTDESGVIVEQYRYDAWGRVLGVYDGNGQALTASAVGNRYLWQGREYSWTTGFYYFRARWYDPITGRWLSNDPLGISGGLNQYVAFDNDPINKIDPFGLCESGPNIFGIGSLPQGPLPYVNPPSPWLNVPYSIANTVPFAVNASLNSFGWAVDTFGIDWNSPTAPYQAIPALVGAQPAYIVGSSAFNAVVNASNCNYGVEDGVWRVGRRRDELA